MEKIVIFLLLTLTCNVLSLHAQESDEIPGDHFSLEGALDLFKKAKSPEEFEKLLNESGNLVNNLDLNKDGDVDYIKVVDNVSSDAHAIVLQVMINENENQDVAVIEIEKTGSEEAVVQIIGDEDIFAEDNIAEPYDETAEEGDGNGPSLNTEVLPIVVNVWGWPCVRFVYAPVYRPWVSPWRWRVYPVWWKPWRPHPLSWMRARRPVYAGFHFAPTHRVVRAHAVYAPHRASSTVVRTTHKVSIDKRRHQASIKTTKTKVTRHGQGGHTKVTKTTKVKKGRRR